MSILTPEIESVLKTLIEKKVGDYILKTKHSFAILGNDLPELASSAQIITSVMLTMNEQMLDSLIDSIKSGDINPVLKDSAGLATENKSVKTIGDIFDHPSCTEIIRFINSGAESEYQNAMEPYWDGDESLHVNNVALITRVRQLVNYDLISNGLSLIINDLENLEPGPSEALKDPSVLKTLAEVIMERTGDSADNIFGNLVFLKALHPEDFHMGLLRSIIHVENKQVEEFSPVSGLVIDRTEP